MVLRSFVADAPQDDRKIQKKGDSRRRKLHIRALLRKLKSSVIPLLLLSHADPLR
jgi:hypothetical protein